MNQIWDDDHQKLEIGKVSIKVLYTFFIIESYFIQSAGILRVVYRANIEFSIVYSYS